MPLLLASGSPRRAELLKAAGFAFDTLVVDLDEQVRVGEVPAVYVRRLAAEKSAAALERIGPAAPNGIVVLGADTTVVIEGQILGKPVDDDDARAMLRRLSGRDHQVMTGISLRTAAEEVGAVEQTTVWFSELTAEAIDWYVGTGDGRDKAGAYAIQGLASRFIPRIDGSYSNVVGLPVQKIAALLSRLRADSGLQESGLSQKP